MEDNSSMRLKHKIDEIQNEKFSAAENVKKSAVLQKTIRKVGTQMVNHDIECKSESLFLSHHYVKSLRNDHYVTSFSVYDGLIELDLDKENLIEDEINARLSRVKKVEMAEPIRCSYGNPDINYFRDNSKMYHTSLSFKNHAHATPTLQGATTLFNSQSAADIEKYLKLMEKDYWKL